MWRIDALPLLRRQHALAGLALAGLAWGLAAAPLPMILAAVGGLSAFWLLIRWPWLVWLGIAALLPVASGLKRGATSVTDLLLVLAVGLWFADGVRRRTVRLSAHPLVGWVLAYVVLLFLSALQASDLGEAVTEVVKWGQVAVVLLIAGDMLPISQRKWLVAAMLVSGVGQALLGLHQFVNQIGPEWFIILDRFMRASGVFHQPNPYAGYLGLTLPVALSLALWGWGQSWASRFARPAILLWTLFYAGAALLISAGIVASWSRGGWFGATAATVVVLVVRSRRALLISGGAAMLLAVALLLGFITPELVPAAISNRLQDVPTLFGMGDVLHQPVTDENFAVVERLAHWAAALRMWSLSPWLGVGPGNYATVYPLVRLPQWEEPLGHAHNIYLNVLGETGLLGLALYLALWLVALVWLIRWWRAYRRQENSWQAALTLGVIGVLVHLSVHQLFDNLFVQGIHLQLALWFAIIQPKESGSTGSQGVDKDSLLVGKLVHQPTNQQTDPESPEFPMSQES
jgi:putative inorganic carbon (HCO3(-)) transporter